ncbi:MAG TPA: hypothetical protein VG164_06880 [Trebonia sp.]|nr:hypothetical protein [Trebonia sp.]
MQDREDTTDRLAVAADTGPADTGPADTGPADEAAVKRPGGGWRGRGLWAAGLAVAAVALSWCYLLQARANPAGSDGAGMALQGWDMLHGNLLLRGWWTADVSFSTFEIPVDALVAGVRGLSADVVHVTAALVYMALVLVAALLARGTARGRAGVIRAVLAAGICVAPSLTATALLLGPPDHIGVAVPIMLTLLLVDRVRARWWVPVVVCVLLVWAQLDDPVAEFAAAAPLALVCLVRAALGLARDRRGSWWYDAALAVAAALSYELTEIAVHAIRAAGGVSMRALSTVTTVMPVAQWGTQLLHTGQNLLLLFGAEYWKQPTGLLTAIAYVHLAGVALALCGVVAGIAGLVRHRDRVTQILTAATALTLGAGAFITQMQPGFGGSHDIAVALPFGAVLAGRAVGSWLARPRAPRRRGAARLALAALLSVALACYLAALGYSAAQPAKPAATQALADWLVRHHLTSGLARYWTANITTLASGERVRVAAAGPNPAHPYVWVTRPSWYDPGQYSANFVIASVAPGNTVYPVSSVQAAFGRPVRQYQVGSYVVMVYDKNLLRAVSKPVQPNPDTGSRL